jgi:hypothetical protein
VASNWGRLRPLDRHDAGSPVLHCFDRNGARTLGRSHCKVEEMARSSESEPADRAHPTAEPARPRPIFDRAQAGRLPGGFAPHRRLQRLIRRLGRALGGRLSSAFEHRQLDRSAALEGPTSSSPRPRPRSASRKIRSTSVRSGISTRTGFRLISSSAFLLSCCGRASRCGSSEQASEIRHVRSSKSWRGSSRMTWSCRSPPMLRSACAASLNPTPHTPLFSTALASSCPNACASPNTKPHSSPLVLDELSSAETAAGGWPARPYIQSRERNHWLSGPNRFQARRPALRRTKGIRRREGQRSVRVLQG